MKEIEEHLKMRVISFKSVNVISSVTSEHGLAGFSFQPLFCC